MEEDKQRDTDVDASNSHTTLHNHTEKGPLYAMDPSKGGCEEDHSHASRLHDAMTRKVKLDGTRTEGQLTNFSPHHIGLENVGSALVGLFVE